MRFYGTAYSNYMYTCIELTSSQQVYAERGEGNFLLATSVTTSPTFELISRSFMLFNLTNLRLARCLYVAQASQSYNCHYNTTKQRICDVFCFEPY